MKFFLCHCNNRMLVFLVMLFPISSIGQEEQYSFRSKPNVPYTFSSEKGIFSLLIGGTVVSGLSIDDAISDKLPLGFSFKLGCESYSNFYASSNGTLSFNVPFGDRINSVSSLVPDNLTLFAPLWKDLSGEGGIFSYKTTGISPNRVFTAEWKNWRLFYSNASDIVTFQIKLYEGTNSIEYIYDGHSNSRNIHASIGLFNGTSNTPESKELWLDYSSTSPIVSKEFIDNIIQPPANGQLYRFTCNDTESTCGEINFYGQTVINKEGGTDSSDGLRITLTGAGNMQIRNNNKNQLYAPYDDLLYGTSDPYTAPGSSLQGLVLSVGNTYFMGGRLTPDINAEKLIVMTSTEQRLIESTTGHFVNEIKLGAVKNNLTYYLTIKYIYNFPDGYFQMDYNVTIPSGNTEVVKLAHGWDTYLEGNDTGPGFVVGTAPDLIVGVKRAPSFEAFEYLGGVQWSGYYSAYYYDLGRNLGSDMKFKNTIDSNDYIDNGIGISMDFGKVPGSFTSSNKLVIACEAGDKGPVLIDKEVICLGSSLDLNNLITSSTPTGTVVVWEDANADELIDPTTITTPGIYTVYYHSLKYTCNSPSSTIDVKFDSTCGICYKPGIEDGIEAGYSTVISTLDRENNPAINPRNGALILESKEKGFAISKVASPENDIAVPVEGMLVYDITSNCLKLYNGILWNCIKQTCIDD